MIIEFFLEDLSLGRLGEFRECLSLLLLCFQVPTLQKNQYTKGAYLWVMCPELLQSYCGMAYSTTFQTPNKKLETNIWGAPERNVPVRSLFHETHLFNKICS